MTSKKKLKAELAELSDKLGACEKAIESLQATNAQLLAENDNLHALLIKSKEAKPEKAGQLPCDDCSHIGVPQTCRGCVRWPKMTDKFESLLSKAKKNK